MPAFNNAVPALPKRFDLRDATDHIDRLLEVLDQAVMQSQGQIFPLTVNPTTGEIYADDTFPRPNYIVSDAGIEAYEAVLTSATSGAGSAEAQTAACITAVAAYGVRELLAAVEAKLVTIPSLS
jgi:hypothetical protein